MISIVLYGYIKDYYSYSYTTHNTVHTLILIFPNTTDGELRSSSGSKIRNTTITTKPFVPGIWGRLHEPIENYTGSDIWISFLHLFLSCNMPSLRPLASISCRIIFIHVFFSLSCALLTCPNLIRFTRRTGASVGLRRTWPNHCRRFSLIFSSIEAISILVRISSCLTLSLIVLPHI